MKIRKTRAAILAFPSGFITSGIVQAAVGGSAPSARHAAAAKSEHGALDDL
jgi:hypothetical protein